MTHLQGYFETSPLLLTQVLQNALPLHAGEHKGDKGPDNFAPKKQGRKPVGFSDISMLTNTYNAFNQANQADFDFLLRLD